MQRSCYTTFLALHIDMKILYVSQLYYYRQLFSCVCLGYSPVIGCVIDLCLLTSCTLPNTCRNFCEMVKKSTLPPIPTKGYLFIISYPANKVNAPTPTNPPAKKPASLFKLKLFSIPASANTP